MGAWAVEEFPLIIKYMARASRFSKKDQRRKSEANSGQQSKVK